MANESAGQGGQGDAEISPCPRALGLQLMSEFVASRAYSEMDTCERATNAGAAMCADGGGWRHARCPAARAGMPTIRIKDCGRTPGDEPSATERVVEAASQQRARSVSGTGRVHLCGSRRGEGKRVSITFSSRRRSTSQCRRRGWCSSPRKCVLMLLAGSWLACLPSPSWAAPAVYIAGTFAKFTTADGVEHNVTGIAEWSEGTIKPLGMGVALPQEATTLDYHPSPPECIRRCQNSQTCWTTCTPGTSPALYLGGSFTSANGEEVYRVTMARNRTMLEVRKT